eukprot:7475580-Pyramimonas_sp.AAC.1
MQPDLLAAFDEKLKAAAPEDYDDGEAKTKLQSALSAMDEARAQAKAVIQTVQLALEGINLAAAQAPLKRRRADEAVDAEGPAATPAGGAAEAARPAAAGSGPGAPAATAAGAAS